MGVCVDGKGFLFDKITANIVNVNACVIVMKGRKTLTCKKLAVHKLCTKGKIDQKVAQNKNQQSRRPSRLGD